jgi:CheY-like chemotaxis protein
VPQTLLLADDSVTIQRVIELTFADQDIQVVAVSDGEQAIAALQQTAPDIVLADVAMPGRSGYEVAQFIRETPRLAHIPVVLLTGAFEPVDQERATSLGCEGVLAKPFEPQLVIGRVKELLARRHDSGEGDVAAPAPDPWASFAAPPSRKEAVQALADDYFDRLDQALSNGSFGSLDFPPLSSTASTSATSATPGAAAPPSDVDWFSVRPAAGFEAERPSPVAPAEPPLSYGSPREHFSGETLEAPPPVPPPASVVMPPPIAEAPAPAVDEPARVSAPSFQPVPAPPAVPPPSALTASPAAPVTAPGTSAVFPPLADAFAALLAAEQASPTPPAAPRWPANLPAPAAITSDEVVAQVTRRVLEQLSDRVVRETVTDIVTGVAERLVLEEIERIKSAIK